MFDDMIKKIMYVLDSQVISQKNLTSKTRITDKHIKYVAEAIEDLLYEYKIIAKDLDEKTKYEVIKAMFRVYNDLANVYKIYVSDKEEDYDERRKEFALSYINEDLLRELEEEEDNNEDELQI
ncbi:MAG: hypothetical protein QXW35_03415 [Candidatus Aenigmatarchaeota archaeon]